MDDRWIEGLFRDYEEKMDDSLIEGLTTDDKEKWMIGGLWEMVEKYQA